jgi:hypothetical protein
VLYPLGQLGADTGPIINAVQVDAQAFFLATGDRVEKTDALDPATIPLVTAVRNHDVVERTFLGASARQTNLYHCLLTFHLFGARPALSAPADSGNRAFYRELRQKKTIRCGFF